MKEVQVRRIQSNPTLERHINSFLETQCGLTFFDRPVYEVPHSDAHKLTPEFIRGTAHIFSIASRLKVGASPGFDIYSLMDRYIRDLNFRAAANALLAGD